MEADADVAASFRHLKRRPREIEAVKFVAERPLADPDAAARKLVEIANATEAVQDGRIYIHRARECRLPRRWRHPGRIPRGPRARDRAGWLWRHESGTYVKFTPVGAELFA
jgi:hypothetical protein